MKLTYCLGLVLMLYSQRVICSAQDEKLSFIKFKLQIIDEIIHNLLNLYSNETNFIDVSANELTPRKLPPPKSTEAPKPFAKPKDCSEVKKNGVTKSGIYEVWILNGGSQTDRFNVFCDMETDGGGWTVFQRRGDFGHPKDYFFRNWKNYSEGFGNLDEDFWLGNNKLHLLTNQGNYSLRIDMGDKENNKRYVLYKEFKVGNEKNLYKLHVGGYSGTTGDSLTAHHNGIYFSTFDKDNDIAPSTNCANKYKGAWWYSNCYDSSLNGLYLNGPHKSYGDGVEWYKWKGLYYSLPVTEMKIRRNS